MLWILALVVTLFVAAALVLRWAEHWGATPEERARAMPGDEWLEDGPKVRTAMTRAISINAPPERVWPWIAQLGRGAGWYSVELLDNGRRRSARHIISWIPEPQLGDAAPIGYLRHLDAGRSTAWWVGGVGFAGARSRLVTSYLLSAEGDGTRLVSRMSADAAGLTAWFALLLFRAIDSLMATRQLIKVRGRVEALEVKGAEPPDPETGARDQYQHYEVLYADGTSAGGAGVEHAATWRQAAFDDGVLAAHGEAPHTEAPAN